MIQLQQPGRETALYDTLSGMCCHVAGNLRTASEVNAVLVACLWQQAELMRSGQWQLSADEQRILADAQAEIITELERLCET